MNGECPTPWKASFESQKVARAVLRGKVRLATKGQQRPYRCPCGAWHLTSMSRNVLRLIRKGKHVK